MTEFSDKIKEINKQISAKLDALAAM